MKRGLARPLWVLGVGAMASQAGHLVVYQIQFGSAALAIQSQGAHAYFPILAKTGLGIACAALLAGLLVIGASRLVAASPRNQIKSVPYMPVLSVLFTIQMTCFVLQETIESLAAGTPTASVVHLILFGSLGQLPVAAIAALALKWMAARIGTAVETLRTGFVTPSPIFRSIEVVLIRQEPAVQFALAEACPAAYVKRGPPRA